LSIRAYSSLWQRPYLPAIAPAAAAAMATPRDPLPDQRRHLERCWQQECDIDPMILRLRLLRHLGSLRQALCLEQELLPLF
jgi:hypothetical protein